MRLSVSLPMRRHHDDHVVTLPRRERATFSATARMRSASATEVPPYFWTIRATACRRYHAAVSGTQARRSVRAGDPASLVACRLRGNTDKRERQKANRQRRLEELQRKQAPQKRRRRAPIVAIVVGARRWSRVLIAVSSPSRRVAATPRRRPPRRPPAPITDHRRRRRRRRPPVPAPDPADPRRARRPTARATRTSTFESPPPTCIDPTKTYTAHRGDHQAATFTDRPRPEDGAQHGQQLRRAGPLPLLRRHRRSTGSSPASWSSAATRRGSRHAAAPATVRRRAAAGEAYYKVGIAGDGQLRARTPTAASSSSSPATRARSCRRSTRCSVR